MSGRPPIEVGVVDVLVFRKVQRGWLVLALERAPDARCPGVWEMVHGKIEDGESLEEAAHRELREETGLTAERLISVGMHAFYLVPRPSVQLCAVFAAVVPATGTVTLGEEHVRHAWLTPSQARRRFTWPQEQRSLDDARRLLATPAVWDVLERQVDAGR